MNGSSVGNTKNKTLRRVLIGLLALILVFSVGSMVFTKGFYDKEFPRYDRKEFSGYLTYEDIQDEYDYAEVSFKSGKNTLKGLIFGKENDKGLVVVAHGIGQGAERYLAEVIYYVDQGWRVFAFDGTGSHASEGKGTRGLPQSLLDLDAVLTYIESEPSLNSLPIMLFGHSWGGYSVAAILNLDHPVHAVVSVAGYNSPDELLFDNTGTMLGPWAAIENPFIGAYQALLFGKFARLSAVDGINQTNTPVMVIHGDHDEDISYTGASIIAHRSEISNPNVVYETISASNRNGHMSLFSSNAAIEYINGLNEQYRMLHDQYQGNIPHDVLVAYYAGVDKDKTSELDAEFMDKTNVFFENSLEQIYD